MWVCAGIYVCVCVHAFVAVNTNRCTKAILFMAFFFWSSLVYVANYVTSKEIIYNGLKIPKGRKVGKDAV